MIKSFITTGVVKEQLDVIFNDFILKTSLDNDLFIAGGFAREVCHAHFNLNSETCRNERTRVFDYLIQENVSGDIDLFSINEKKCISITEKIQNYINKLYSHSEMLYDNYNNIMSFQSLFASNYIPFFSNKEYLFNKKINIQIVNKFFFENIKDCFDSMDLVNCKYALKKEGENYVVYYDTDALKNDRNKSLGLNSSSSPFTISRIVKYLKYRNLTDMSNDFKTQDIFLECLYKAIENNWPSIYNINVDVLKNNIKRLHRAVNLKPEQLSIFIGFIKDQVVSGNIKVPCSSGYGIYVTNFYKDIDWATNKLIDACK